MITRTSDSTSPASVADAQTPPARAMPRIAACSATRTPAGGQRRLQEPGGRGHVDESGLDVQPSRVGGELREPPPQRRGGEGLAAQLQLLQHGVAAEGVGAGQVGGDAALGQVQASAVDEQRLAGLRLQVQPELPGLVGEPGVLGVQVVVPRRPGERERRRGRVTDPRLLQHGHGRGERRRVVGGHEPHDPAADDRQPLPADLGHGHSSPRSSASPPVPAGTVRRGPPDPALTRCLRHAG